MKFKSPFTLLIYWKIKDQITSIGKRFKLEVQIPSPALILN